MASFEVGENSEEYDVLKASVVVNPQDGSSDPQLLIFTPVCSNLPHRTRLVCVTSRIDGRNNGMSFLRLGYKRHCGFHLGYSWFTQFWDNQLLWRGPCRGETEASNQ